MQLVIAEKPLLGKAIADAIPGQAQNTKDSVITKTWNGDTIKIIWCFGHLLELKRPEDYNEKYKKWTLDDLPIYFPGWEKQPPVGDTSKQARAKQIGQLLREASVVIHAGDIDDEGQCIVDEILDYFHFSGEVRRLDTRDIAPAALLRSFKNMDDNSLHRADGTAAYARQVCDALFGFNLSRYYTLINQNTKMTVGRVQTPTLGLVVRRDLAIEGHTKRMFYTLYVDVEVEGRRIRTKFVPAKENKHLEDGLIFDKFYLEEVVKAFLDTQCHQCTVTESQSIESPPLPFNTTKLNGYCGSHWGMSPAKVLSITQSLRDEHKAITYNRSECRYLSMELHKEASQTISSASQNLGIAPGTFPFDASIRSKAFDDSKIGAHMGIIPTAISVEAKSKFTPDQYKVYEAISNYYLAQFLPPAKKSMTKLVIELPGYGALVATASEYTEQGYRLLLKGGNQEDGTDSPDGDEEPSLQKMKPGQYVGTVRGQEIKEGETKPPAKYTQTTLEEDMTRIARYCTNAKVKELLLLKDKDKTGENGSIGTSATRAAIISGLISHGLLREVSKGKRKYVEATAKGRELYKILPDNIRGVDVTAKWWCLTEDIKAGKYTPEQMAQNVLLTVNAVLSSGAGRIEGIEKIAKDVRGECLGKCPKCGGDVFENKYGYACTSTECKFILWRDNKLFQAIGKQLTPKAASLLLSKGRVGLKNCKSARTGKNFDAILVADFSGDSVQFCFDDSSSKEPVCTCPRCGGQVFEKGQRLECRSEGCGFVFWKSNRFLDSICKTLSLKEAVQLIETGKLDIKNAKSAKTKKVIKSCQLRVDVSTTPPQWSIEFPK